MRRLAAFAVATLTLAACQQTVHLYQPMSDAGTGSGKGGSGGVAQGGGGQGGRKTGTGGSLPTDGGQPDGRCFGGPTVLAFTPDTPQMVIAVDRSTAMNQPYVPDSQSQLNDALTDISAQVYEYTNAKFNHALIAFSFLSFPDYAPGCQPGGCCASDVTGDWQHFWPGVTGCATPSSNCVTSASRPVDKALQKAKATLTSANAARPFQRYVLLVTDGSPNTDCSGNDCLPAVAAVSDLVGQAIKLFVVGIGDQSAIGTCPKNLVTAAGDFGHYYPAPTDTDLQFALGQAMAVAVCGVTLTTPPSSTNNLQVSINGSPIAPGSRDGWTYDGMGHVRLHGNSCTSYAESAPQELFITNGCDMGHTGSGGPP